VDGLAGDCCLRRKTYGEQPFLTKGQSIRHFRTRPDQLHVASRMPEVTLWYSVTSSPEQLMMFNELPPNDTGPTSKNEAGPFAFDQRTAAAQPAETRIRRAPTVHAAPIYELGCAALKFWL
jgi:hypothetical protein